MNWPWETAETFDGGETGCGELLLDLRLRFQRLPAGTLIAVRALDAGAPNEIPAWCRLTKNALLEARHPFYLIQTPNIQP
jgi:tRNA 2-thiouridine synthesizing protein A